MKLFRNLALLLALGALPAYLVPSTAQAQQNDDRQRAYQTGYQNGINDRQHGKRLNLTTDDWKGINLQAYQQGYEAGYRNGGNGGYGAYGQDRDDRNGGYGNEADQRAYQAGYQNGTNDAREGKSLNLRTDNWHGDRLQAYERGYESGYKQNERQRRHGDDDDAHHDRDDH